MLKAALQGVALGAVYMAAHAIVWQVTKRRIARRIEKKFR